MSLLGERTRPDNPTKSTLAVASVLISPKATRATHLRAVASSSQCEHEGATCHLSPASPPGLFSYLEFDVVTDELVALHELLLVAPVLGDHWESVVDGGAQDADQGLDAGVWVDVGQVGLHDVTGSQSGEGGKPSSLTPEPRAPGTARDGLRGFPSLSGPSGCLSRTISSAPALPVPGTPSPALLNWGPRLILRFNMKSPPTTNPILLPRGLIGHPLPHGTFPVLPMNCYLHYWN